MYGADAGGEGGEGGVHAWVRGGGEGIDEKRGDGAAERRPSKPISEDSSGAAEVTATPSGGGTGRTSEAHVATSAPTAAASSSSSNSSSDVSEGKEISATFDKRPAVAAGELPAVASGVGGGGEEKAKEMGKGESRSLPSPSSDPDPKKRRVG